MVRKRIECVGLPPHTHTHTYCKVWTNLSLSAGAVAGVLSTVELCHSKSVVALIAGKRVATHVNMQPLQMNVFARRRSRCRRRKRWNYFVLHAMLSSPIWTSHFHPIYFHFFLYGVKCLFGHSISTSFTVHAFCICFWRKFTQKTKHKSFVSDSIESTETGANSSTTYVLNEALSAFNVHRMSSATNAVCNDSLRQRK